MQALFDQLKDLKDYESYQISFESNGELSLQCIRTPNAVMLLREMWSKLFSIYNGCHSTINERLPFVLFMNF